eukprot:TRINITY_DN17845_c0_g1_i5.p1 TRINITY_DN17845_c0_g1~~TRINITY_DN17845_c0_g1_i5.p1  ORF type:complete len:185 (+),score=2.23 TRINITY_DN17845_c0_g1_i5:517-1071(+)
MCIAVPLPDEDGSEFLQSLGRQPMTERALVRLRQWFTRRPTRLLECNQPFHERLALLLGFALLLFDHGGPRKEARNLGFQGLSIGDLGLLGSLGRAQCLPNPTPHPNPYLVLTFTLTLALTLTLMLATPGPQERPGRASGRHRLSPIHCCSSPPCRAAVPLQQQHRPPRRAHFARRGAAPTIQP